MVDSLSLALTPDSMITFRDTTWPMLVMSFLAFTGNSFYPCFLRSIIWMLDHPRRCYTLLFPSSTTWILAAILIVLNSLDILLIVVLDLDNPEVNVLPVGLRILVAIFQAASSRHTGTALFSLENVNPTVQFSVLVMMFTSIYPNAISIRMSTQYKELPLGSHGMNESPDERRSGKTCLVKLLRKHSTFDLWYVFLGVFCICCAESKHIMDRENYVSIPQ
jgi:Trk-type K+ transport system membrane component